MQRIVTCNAFDHIFSGTSSSAEKITVVPTYCSHYYMGISQTQVFIEDNAYQMFSVNTEYHLLMSLPVMDKHYACVVATHYTITVVKCF